MSKIWIFCSLIFRSKFIQNSHEAIGRNSDVFCKIKTIEYETKEQYRFSGTKINTIHKNTRKVLFFLQLVACGMCCVLVCTKGIMQVVHFRWNKMSDLEKCSHFIKSQTKAHEYNAYVCICKNWQTHSDTTASSVWLCKYRIDGL